MAPADDTTNWKKRAQHFEALFALVVVLTFIGMYFTRKYGESVGMKTCGPTDVVTAPACHDVYLTRNFWDGSLVCPRDDQRIEAVDGGFFCRCSRAK